MEDILFIKYSDISFLPKGLITDITVPVIGSIFDKSTTEFSMGLLPLRFAYSIRTIFTNKVLVTKFPQPSAVATGYCVSHNNTSTFWDMLTGIKEHLDFNYKEGFEEALSSSNLKLIGVINTDGYFTAYYHVIVEDKYENGYFMSSAPHECATFEEISSLEHFTNLCNWTNMVSPTFKIVKG